MQGTATPLVASKTAPCFSCRRQLLFPDPSHLLRWNQETLDKSGGRFTEPWSRWLLLALGFHHPVTSDRAAWLFPEAPQHLFARGQLPILEARQPPPPPQMGKDSLAQGTFIGPLNQYKGDWSLCAVPLSPCAPLPESRHFCGLVRRLGG